MNADRDLVAAVLAGRSGAFERLVLTHQQFCWHILYRLVKHADDARDLCQETFLRVHRQLHQFRGDSSLKAWIGRVAYTIGLRHLERRRIDIEHSFDGATEGTQDLPDNTNLEAEHAQSDIAQRIRCEIDRLPPLPRLLITLYHLDELSIGQIREITDLPIGTIKSHLFRARLHLRVVLEPLQDLVHEQ